MNSSSGDATGLDSGGMGSPKSRLPKRTQPGPTKVAVDEPAETPPASEQLVADDVADANVTSAAQGDATDPLALFELAREVIGRDSSHATNIFENYDRDKSGVIDQLDFRRGLAQLGLALNEVQFAALMPEVDKDGRGAVDYNGMFDVVPEMRRSSVVSVKPGVGRKFSTSSNRSNVDVSWGAAASTPKAVDIDMDRLLNSVDKSASRQQATRRLSGAVDMASNCEEPGGGGRKFSLAGIGRKTLTVGL